MNKRKSTSVIFPRPKKVDLTTIPLPPMGSSDVLVQVEYSSISVGTERWCLTAGLEIPDQPPLEFPHVPGYQAAGVVIETGKDVIRVKPGDRVFSRNCRKPEDFKGSWWGGHVGLHVAESRSVIPLPDKVSPFEASSLLLAQVGYNGASKPRVKQGDVALVIGEGLVGQYAGQVLRHRGAHVIIAGLNKKRLLLASRYSADDIFDNSDDTLGDFISEKYPDGVSIVLDTASNSRTVRLGTQLLSQNGQLVMNGFYPPSESRIDWHWLRRKEITVYCPDSRTKKRLEATLGLIASGHMYIKELVTHIKSVTDAPDMYRMLLDQSGDYLGIVFDWSDI